MAKNNSVMKDCEEECDADFSEMMESSYDDEMMDGVVNGLIEASNNQMMLAIELTRVVTTTKDMTPEQVFSIFKQASEVVADSFPLKSLMEKLPGSN